MEKKVEVVVNGRKFRIPEHMVEDFARFGATRSQRIVKPAPDEILKTTQPKKIILPNALENLPVMEVKEEVKEEVKPVVKRKPVKRVKK